MIIDSNPLLGLHDVTIVPAVTSRIVSRKECNPFVKDGLLPLVTAPMDTVINEHNWETFAEKGVLTVIPRTVDINIRLGLMDKTFVGMSLTEFIKHFCTKESSEELKALFTANNTRMHVCIDIANGHMQQLLDIVKLAKESLGETIVIMTGNIANPGAYVYYALAGVDYVRVGIGTGSRCTTSANTGVHFPLASLLDNINTIRINSRLPFYPKVIADGGFSNYDDIIKALALGADLVMLGRLFAQTEEACGRIAECSTDKVKFREYRGMSTKDVQKLLGKESLRTSEGISGVVEVKGSLSSFLENFKDYLTSAMSYCNSYSLEEFSSRAAVARISTEARLAYFK